MATDTESEIAKDSGTRPNANPREGDTQGLVSSLVWAQRSALGIGLFFLVLFALRRSPASLIIGCGLLGLICPLMFSGA